MNLNSLLDFVPALPFAILAGLVVSAGLRRRHWAPLVWIPTVAALLLSSALLLAEAVKLSPTSGRHNDIGILGLLVIVPALALCGAGLIAACFSRPRAGWNRRATTLGATMSVAALGFFQWRSAASIELRILDNHGIPVNKFETTRNNGPRINGYPPLQMHLQRRQSLEVTIHPSPPSSSKTSSLLVSYMVRLRAEPHRGGNVVVMHSWSRRISPDVWLVEGFAEIMPFRRGIRLDITLPTENSLDQVPAPDRLDRAFRSIGDQPKTSDPSLLTYAYVSGNLGAIAFLPKLLSLCGGDRQTDFSARDGLGAIARLLSTVHQGCQDIRANLHRGSPSSPSTAGDFIPILGAWAGVPPETLSDDLQTLDLVEKKLADIARPLVDSALQPTTDGNVLPGVLTELGPLNRAYLDIYITTLIAHPPTTLSVARQWNSLFFRMQARPSALKPLIESSNPLLHEVARDLR